MSAHNILTELSRASSDLGRVFVVIPSTATIPSGVAGFAIGCLLIKPGDAAYLNKGTLGSCNFTKITQA
jgi:hypothetical protein